MISVFHNPTLGKSAYLSAINREKPFVIGFRDRKLAEHVYKHIHPSKLPELRHQRLSDLTEEFNACINQVDLPKEFALKHFQLDIDAVLTIPKHKTPLKPSFLHETYDIVDVPESEFLLYPFERYVGIAVPFSIDREFDDYISMSAYLIDPAESPRLFKI